MTPMRYFVVLLLCTFGTAQVVPTFDKAPDRGCTESQTFNSSIGECVCIQGLTPNQCDGPNKGVCGFFNGAVP
jgi:hypothetical protein